MEIKFLHLLGHHRNLIDLLSSKMDKIHETTVSRHWTTDSPRLIPEKETNKVSPHCPSSLPSQGRELKESLVVLEGEERERECVCTLWRSDQQRGPCSLAERWSAYMCYKFTEAQKKHWGEVGRSIPELTQGQEQFVFPLAIVERPDTGGIRLSPQKGIASVVRSNFASTKGCLDPPWKT